MTQGFLFAFYDSAARWLLRLAYGKQKMQQKNGDVQRAILSGTVGVWGILLVLSILLLVFTGTAGRCNFLLYIDVFVPTAVFGWVLFCRKKKGLN